jgi:hypothetical protein
MEKHDSVLEKQKLKKKETSSINGFIMIKKKKKPGERKLA